MDDYYELLDVAPDAEREDIRLSYRAKRDELQAQEGADNRAKIAELNRAWNVLGDAIQRQRYDNRLAESRASKEENAADDGDAAERPIPVTRAQRRDEMRRARQQKLPTITLPNGMTAAPTRNRLMAFATDIVILLALFSAVSLIGGRQVDNHFPGEQHKQTQEIKQANKIHDQINAEKKKVSDAQKRHDTAAANAAKAKQDKLQKQYDVLKKDIDRITREFAPGLKLVFAIGVLVAFLYLVPLTALTGQTIGKRLQKIRVVKLADGSIPGWAVATKRFGAPLGLSLVLGVLFLNEFALLIGIVIIIGWVNRPDRQGIHDRLAKTVVVQA